jgi:hypothetical protein
MNSWNSYPKVWNIGHPNIAEIFEDEVLIEEKIDGSQFSFGVFNGDLKCKSKSVELDINAPEKMFLKAVQTAVSLAPLLKDGWTYRAEYLSKPKHNTLAYERTPEKNLIIFDINIDLETYLKYEYKKQEAERLGLEIVPTFGSIKINNSENLLELLEKTSCLGGQKIEGIVCKNYNQFGRDGKVLLCKYVSEKFREKHKLDWKERNKTNNDIIDLLGQSFRTEARWEKAIIHLLEKGEIGNSPDPKYIGKIIKEIQQDIEEECFDIIAKKLASAALPRIKKIVSRGFPEWYKEKMLKSQFN